jgi:alpha-L-fucosidase
MTSFLRSTACCGAAVLVAAVILPLVAMAQPPTPFGAVPNARQVEWFHRERQVLLHFGMNTFSNVEWGTGNEDPKQFNPTALDCGQWARTIKKGGFTSAIIVAKHFDGFCGWPSEYTDFDVASSNWRGGKGDLIREFVDSCRAYGIKPGFYMGVGDFHSEKLGNYPTYFMNQTREILKNYGTIREMWWDGANVQAMDSAIMKNIADTIHQLQPNCVIWSDQRGKNAYADARWIGTESGLGTGDPCWATENMAFSNLDSGILGGSVYCPAEVSSSIRPGWFWHQSENNSVNTVEVLWNKYFQSVGRNATWTLNLPPDTRGLISASDSMRVECLNSWIDETFRTNLAEGATVNASHPRGAGYEPANLVDSAEATYYATPDSVNTDTIVFDLGSAKTFDVLMLREVIELGHRTTGWSVDYSSDNASYASLCANKQSIGYKWLEKSNPVTARYVRLKITKGQACITLNTFGLYKQRKTPADPVGTGAPAGPRVAARSVVVPVFGRSLELPPAFAARPFTAALLDLRGRTLAVMRIDTKPAPTGARTLAAVDRPGLYIIRCTGESGVVIRKLLYAATE